MMRGLAVAVVLCVAAVLAGCPPSELCQPPASGPTMHSADLTADETWTADGSPHVVTTTIRLRNAAALTIEPCATVELAAGAALEVGWLQGSSRLVAEGTAQRPIVFRRHDAGPWAGINIDADATPAASASLAYVSLDGAGANSSHDNATLSVSGDATELRTPLKLDHVGIQGSAGVGLAVDYKAALAPGSTDLTISGSGSYPVEINSAALGTLPAGSYTGNGTDAVRVLPRYDVVSDTLHEVGVPYLLEATDGYLRVAPPNSSSTASLTIEPGVTMKFGLGTFLWIGQGSASGVTGPAVVIANGTADKPIVFTSAQSSPAAGDWRGLVFRGSPSTGNSLRNVRIEYAGGDCSCTGYSCATNDNAAVEIMNWIPGDAFLQSSAISHSASNGIVSGWAANSGTDLRPTNTFTNVALCQQTLWRNALNACPSPNPECL